MKSIYGKFMYLQTVAQGLTQIFSDFIYTNASHGSDSQSPDEGIWVLCILIIPLNLFCLTTIEQYNSYLLESIYSQNCTLWLAFGIVHNVQIYKFLELQVVCLHTVQHVSEQHRHILAHGHEGNHLLDCLLLFILFLWVQLFLELVDLTYGVLPAVPQHSIKHTFLGGLEVFGVRHGSGWEWRGRGMMGMLSGCLDADQRRLMAPDELAVLTEPAICHRNQHFYPLYYALFKHFIFTTY